MFYLGSVFCCKFVVVNPKPETRKPDLFLGTPRTHIGNQVRYRDVLQRRAEEGTGLKSAGV